MKAREHTQYHEHALFMQKPVKQVVWWGRGSKAGQYTPSNPGYYIGLPWAPPPPLPARQLPVQPASPCLDPHRRTATAASTTSNSHHKNREIQIVCCDRALRKCAPRALARERGNQEEKARVVVLVDERQERLGWKDRGQKASKEPNIIF